MRLFSADLYRNFAIGFAAGAALIAGAHADTWGDELSPPAHAAQTPHTPGPAAEAFLAVHEGRSQ